MAEIIAFLETARLNWKYKAILKGLGLALLSEAEKSHVSPLHTGNVWVSEDPYKELEIIMRGSETRRDKFLPSRDGPRYLIVVRYNQKIISFSDGKTLPKLPMYIIGLSTQKNWELFFPEKHILDFEEIFYLWQQRYYVSIHL